MNFIFYLTVFATLALVAYNVIHYLNTTGTVAERLSGCWKGSMTIFTLIWTTIVGLIVDGANFMSQITGDPQFSNVGNAIKDAVGPSWAPIIGISVIAAPLVLGTIARTRSKASPS